MDSYLMTNTALDISNDPFMMALSSASVDSTTTFFDSFASSADWLWTLGPPTWEEPAQVQPVVITQTQLDAFKYELASPVPSPCDFIFEIGEDTTKYEPCYDEFMDAKLDVLKELLEKEKARPVIVQPSPAPLPDDPLPLSALESLFEGAYTLPDDFIDNLWEELNSLENFDASPSLSTSTSTSASTASTISISTPPSSEFNFSCLAPELEDTTSWLEFWDNGNDGSVDDNPRDDDYQPFQVRNEYHHAPRKRVTKKQQGQCHKLPTHIGLLSEPFPDAPIKKKQKRKALPSAQETSKRQKLDPEAVCRIKGCRHVSKTRFECFKHRETHFPGRFQCPHPSCRKVFVRSSSLSRHLKRPHNVDCASFAGGPLEWGTGLINFALHPPAWLAPGFLDDITEV